MRNARMDEAQAEIKIAGENIKNLRYADDTTLMTESKEELKSFAGVQPRLIQGTRSGDGVGDLFNYLFIKDIKSNRIRIAQ